MNEPDPEDTLWLARSAFHALDDGPLGDVAARARRSLVSS